MLDFGCGNGAQSFSFAADFDRIVGVDLTLSSLQQLMSWRGEAPIYPVLYEGGPLPIADASVDRVTSFEVLEHVRDERQALAEMHRVLRPGGQLVISVPNRWWIFETHGADLPMLPWNRVPFFSWLPKSIHDRYARARIYRRREILALLQATGFTISDSVYVTAPMDVLPWQPLRTLLRSTIFAPDTTALPFLATAVLVVAKK